MSMFNWFKKRENVYHRYLDIPMQPGIDLFSRTDYDPMYYRHIKVEGEEINPELVSWFEMIYYNETLDALAVSTKWGSYYLEGTNNIFHL